MLLKGTFRLHNSSLELHNRSSRTRRSRFKVFIVFFLHLIYLMCRTTREETGTVLRICFLPFQARNLSPSSTECFQTDSAVIPCFSHCISSQIATPVSGRRTLEIRTATISYSSFQYFEPQINCFLAFLCSTRELRAETLLLHHSFANSTF